MITPDDAVKQIDSLIEQINTEMVDGKEVVFHVSKEFANAIKDAINIRSMKAMPDFVSGDEFKWRDYICKVK
jgi:hypothetical protein